jgi:RNA polymerase sigma factor (sigma-70 family)
MNGLTDQELLRDYIERRSETSFAEVVRRHLDFVYSAALRMLRDAHLAEDVTQAVFVALAQNARQLTNRPILSGWLHRTTQNLAAKTVRSDVRRRAREQEAVTMNELLSTEPEADWQQIAPHLDNALGELSEPDRDALLLRYFEQKSAREMAQTLGTSEEAAQKRVSRAVERMRELFEKRGVTVGASGLVIALSTHGVQAAPTGFSASITAATALTKSTATITTALTAKALAATIASVAILGVGTQFLLSQNKKMPNPIPAETKIAVGSDVTGILKTADGQPLPDTKVYLATGFVPVPVYTEPSSKVQFTRTGRDGRFSFPEDSANRAVIVINEKGYGQATVTELASRPELTLQPWARIEGILREGNAPMANQTIHLSRTRFGSKLQQQTFRTVHDTVTTTDAKGHYLFAQVAPGDTWISWKKNPGGYDLQFRYLDVQPGQSITTDIGGRGRPITGRALLAQPEGDVPPKFFGSVWPATPHRMQRPPNWPEMPPDQQESMTAAWERSPDAKLFNQEQCPIDFRLTADGTFTVPDLPAGDYRVVVATWTGAPAASQLVTRGSANITIEAMRTGRSDEPLDIGSVQALPVRPLRDGDVAPLFEATTFAGAPLKLAEYKGKHVLLHFWRGQDPETQQAVEYLKLAQATWGQDKRFVMIGLTVEQSVLNAHKYATDAGFTWTQCFLGKISDIPVRYRLRRPTTILIGPDGLILRADLQGPEIADVLTEVLGKK